MVALIVSYFLLAYLFAPRAIFRWASVFFPLKFQRTRTEEITFAFWISFIPLIIAICVDLEFWGWSDASARINYREVFSAAYSEALFDKNPERFWVSLHAVVVGQSEFLLLYYPVVVLETAIFVWLIKMHGEWRSKSRLYESFVQRVLLRTVSEWHVLLTDFNFPKEPKRKVVADLLTEGDHLYQGDVAEYFVDSEGALSGLILSNPRRFDRQGYLNAKQTNRDVKSDAYWKEIPSANLYLPREKLLNLNVRYPIAEQRLEAVNEELRKEGLELQVVMPSNQRADPQEDRR